jgi:hypothetical protein
MALFATDSSFSASNASPIPSPRSVLTPIVTSPSAQPSPRPAIMAAKNRFSTFSIHSNSSLTQAHPSRPQSMAFPQFHSSLPYALVRDFAYPAFHPLHYGPSPDAPSGSTTPASESQTRPQSDPVPGWDDIKGQWATWSSSNDQLPHKAFGEKDGPPWSEDEDLQSPVVTSVRHRKRSPEQRRGSYTGTNGDGSETYYVSDANEAANGPGGEYITYPPTANDNGSPASVPGSMLGVDQSGRRRDSHFAATLPTRRFEEDEQTLQEDSSSQPNEDFWSTDESRYSRDYQFTIVSPEEEMHGKAVALFDFVRENENELPLCEGQIILVSYRHGQGWLVAQDPMTSESGLVPEEYVRLLRDIEGGVNGLMQDPPRGSPSEPSDSSEAKTPTQESSNSHSHKDSKTYTPVVSTFSTSREDFKEPRSRDRMTSPGAMTPTEHSRRISEDFRKHRLEEHDEVNNRMEPKAVS